MQIGFLKKHYLFCFSGFFISSAALLNSATLCSNPLWSKYVYHFEPVFPTYPIDRVYPNKKIYHAIITIPEEYVPGTLPSPEDMTSELVDMKYSAVKKDDQTIEINFEYYFKKSVYPASDYQKIKTFYNFIVKKGNEKIVFVKNSGS